MNSQVTAMESYMVFKHTESFIVTREALLKEFLNAETPYDSYKAFMKAISWLESKEELAHYREQEIARLRSKNSV